MVNITVASVNDDPVAGDDPFTTNEDTPFLINTADLLVNDSDVETTDLLIVSFDQPANGTVVDQGGGTWLFTPDANFNGNDSFTYTITDADGGTAVGNVLITVNTINDVPVAFDDSFSTTEDSPGLTINLADLVTNDTDDDFIHTLTASIAQGTQPANGTLTDNMDGTLTYVPDANFNGMDSFEYVVSDGNGGTDTAMVNIVVTPINDDPVAGADSITTDEDTQFVINAVDLLGNDSDAETATGDLTITIDGQPTNGTVVDQGDGTWLFTPNANFNGTDSFTYTITDVDGETATGNVLITVNSVNDVPVSGDDAITTDEDTPFVISTADLLLNDSDTETDLADLTIAITTQPGAGTVVDQGDGTWLFTPNTNFSGTDSFTYTVTDEDGGTDTGNVDITVNSVNDDPVAGADEIATDEDTPFIINTVDLLGNDSDIETDTNDLTITIDGQPTNGTVVDQGDGTWLFTPNTNFSGTDSFTYTVTDEDGGTATATVDIDVVPVNDLPVTDDDAITTDEDTPFVISTADLLLNDSDTETDSADLAIAITTQPGAGTVVDQGDGTWLFTPDADFNGSDSFTYTITDADGGTATGNVDITVESVNDLPVAVDDSFTTQEDIGITGSFADLLDNDSDADGDTLTATLFTPPTNGTVTDNLDGTFTYVPNVDFNGTDSFTYLVDDGNSGTTTATVEIEVASDNDLPVAVDDAILVNEDTPFLVDTTTLLSNDFDLDGTIQSIDIASQPEFGTVVDQGDGTWVFTPNNDFAGSDSFTYTITDNLGGEATGTVLITVEDINDQPVAGDDGFSVLEDSSLEIQSATVLSNDTDPDDDTLSAAIISQPTNGTVFDNGQGIWTYTPRANFNGTDSFTYQLRDGNGGSSIGVVTIEVAPVNDNPVAVSNEFQTLEDRPITILKQVLLANDFDIDGDELSISLLGQPQNGTLIDNGESIEYVPDANFNGTDNLVYQISDGNGGSASAALRIVVVPVNDAPVGVDDNYTVAEGLSLNVATGVLANDSDVDGDTITARVVTQPENGQLILNANGSFVYVHDGSETTSDQFEYEVVDQNGVPSLATVSIEVTPTNDAPVTADDLFLAREDTVLNVDSASSVLANDSDQDGDAIAASLTDAPSNGTVNLNDDGTFVYTPDADFVGTDSFEYRATDSNGNSSTASVTIRVDAVNDIPIAVDESFTSANGEAVNGNVLENDIDPDGDNLSVRILRQPDSGQVRLLSDGTFQYLPDAGTSGTDSFTYEVTDGQAAPAGQAPITATVTIEVDEPAFAGNAPVPTDPGNSAPAETTAPAEAPIEAAPVTAPPQLNGSNLTDSSEDTNDDDDSDFAGADPRANLRGNGGDGQSAVGLNDDGVEPGQFVSAGSNITPYNRAVQSAKFTTLEAQQLANSQSGADGATSSSAGTSRLIEALSSNAFIEGLDSVITPLTTSAIAPELMVQSVVMATSTLSVGYFLWVVRTGYFLASCLSASPAWQSYDPLPIMASVQHNEDDDLPETDQDRELEAMMGVKPQ